MTSLDQTQIAQATWKTLEENNLVHGDMPNSVIIDPTPWYIRTLSGIAGWLASFFLLGFFAMALSDFLFDSKSLSINFIGFCLIAVAFGIFRTKKANEFLKQLALACSLCGQLLLAILWLDGPDSFFRFFSLFLLQAALAVVVPNFLHRVICSWFSCVALFWAFQNIGNEQLGSIIVLLSFTLIWLYEKSWNTHRHLFEALGLGVALALVHLNGHLLYLDDINFWREQIPTHALPALNTLALAGVFIGLLTHLKKETGFQFSVLNTSVIAAVFGVFMGLSLLVPAGATALMVLVVGYATQRKVLILLGILSLIGFLSWYYYQLEQTLLFKSLVLMGAGLLFLTVYGIQTLQKRLQKATLATRNRQATTTGVDIRKLATLATCVLILLASNWDIYKKEIHIREGQSIYLKLAPVDPRSLMQGDYMRLRFEVANNLNTALKNSDSTDNTDNTDGKIVVELDENGVGGFLALHTSQQLDENQIAIRYRIRNGKTLFATNAWFFEEGQAARFERAEYGEFKVNQNGELILVAMRDKDLNKL